MVVLSASSSRGLGDRTDRRLGLRRRVILILLRVISPEEAYSGLRPEVLLLIAGMVVVGLSMEVTGLAASGTGLLIDFIRPFGSVVALGILHGSRCLPPNCCPMRSSPC